MQFIRASALAFLLAVLGAGVARAQSITNPPSGGGGSGSPATCTITAGGTTCSLTGAVINGPPSASDSTTGKAIIIKWTGLQTTTPTCTLDAAIADNVVCSIGNGGANGPPGPAGGVSTFSAGNLAPLFTTSVATATTTPALSFAASTFSADNIFGNFTGSTAAPSTQGIPSCANDGAHALVYVSHVLTCASVTGGGGGGATAINQLTDAVCVRTSSTLVTCSTPSGGTNFGSSSVVTARSTNWTITISTGASGNETFYVYWNPVNGAINIDTSGPNSGLACFNCTLVNASVSGYPPDVKPLARLTAGMTASTWDAFSTCLPTNGSGCIDDRALLSLSVTKAGTNLTASVDAHGIKTINFDPTSNVALTGGFQHGATSTDPVCTGTGDIGKQWMDNTSSVTTHFKVCASVSSSPAWVTVF